MHKTHWAALLKFMHWTAWSISLRLSFSLVLVCSRHGPKKKDIWGSYVESLEHWEPKVSAALVIRGRSTTSHNEEDPVSTIITFRPSRLWFQRHSEQCLWLKRLWPWGRHRCFWRLPGLKPSPLRWKEKNGCYFVGVENQFLEPTPFGDCGHTRKSMPIYTPVLHGSSEPLETGSGNRQMKNKMSAPLLIEHWEKKV